MNTTEALLNVILDGQAYLYALIQSQKPEWVEAGVTTELFEQWQQDWKDQTVELAKMLKENHDDE